jgi:hypothetical protein
MSDTIEKALRQLQGMVRTEPKNVPQAMSKRLPDSLTSGKATHLVVGSRVRDAIKDFESLLLNDLRFEYLGESIQRHVWNFVCLSAMQHNTNHVQGFMSQLVRQPETIRCFYAIDHLKVAEPFRIAGVNFLPQTGEGFGSSGRFLEELLKCEGFAEVTLTGTNTARMVDRGRLVVDHTLRLLRLSLARKGLSDIQLRFRSGIYYILPETGSFGWQSHPDLAVTCETIPSFIEYLGTDLLDLPGIGTNDATKHALSAMSWIDQAQLAVDPINRTLFLFFALEALLGDTSAGLKSQTLVFNRVMLGEIVSGGFFHPVPLYWLYDEVRSSAVHGDEPPQFPLSEVESLEWNVRNALYEYVTFCRDRKLTSRAGVRRELLKDREQAEKGLKWLRQRDPRGWFADWSPWGNTAIAAQPQQVADAAVEQMADAGVAEDAESTPGEPSSD